MTTIFLCDFCGTPLKPDFTCGTPFCPGSHNNTVVNADEIEPEDELFDWPCPLCYGTGLAPDRIDSEDDLLDWPCPFCNGTGFAPDEIEPEDERLDWSCPFCNGTGFAPDDINPCEDCGGTGSAE